MKRLANFRKQVIEGWTVQRIAAVLIVVGLVVFVFGVVNKHCACAGWPNLGETANDVISDLYANIFVDSLSVSFTILVIDRLNKRRADDERRAQLIREMGSEDKTTAINATNELRAHGWHSDGSLRGANFVFANLEGADLPDADLERANFDNAKLMNVRLENANLRMANLSDTYLSGAYLYNVSLEGAKLAVADLTGAMLDGANLSEADLTGTNLRRASLRYANLEGTFRPFLEIPDMENMPTVLYDLFRFHKILGAADALQGATMWDGQLYDGCYNLQSDLIFATSFKGINGDSPEELAGFYDVSLERYLNGQQWAEKTLMPFCGNGLPSDKNWNLKSLEEEYNEGPFAGQAWARKLIARLRREAGLDPATALLLPPTNGTEPQPADASAAPAPRLNGHKASMVAHRVRP